jgi:hypothetical protein
MKLPLGQGCSIFDIAVQRGIQRAVLAVQQIALHDRETV